MFYFMRNCVFSWILENFCPQVKFVNIKYVQGVTFLEQRFGVGQKVTFGNASNIPFLEKRNGIDICGKVVTPFGYIIIQ